MSPSKRKIKLKEKKKGTIILHYTGWKQWHDADVKRLQ